ncbi:MAG: hypothetical protein V5A34_03725, partial [Halapricum sp.]
AIDIDRRVLETPEHDRYVVLDEDVVYSYEPPASVEDREDPLKGSDSSVPAGGLEDEKADDDNEESLFDRFRGGASSDASDDRSDGDSTPGETDDDTET